MCLTLERGDRHARSLPVGINAARQSGFPMIRQIIRVRGQDLWVVVKPGAKTKPALLLFNGIGANAELAEPFMREMGDVETVIFDVPGVGRSPAPALPYRPSTVARWAAGVASELGYDRLDVAGVSWGGAMAQQFAHQFPELCRRLILAATAPGVLMVPGKPSVLWRMASPRRYMDPEIYAVDRGGDLRRKVPYGPEPRRRTRGEHEGRLQSRLRLSTTCRGRLDERSVAAVAEAADVDRHGPRRSRRAAGQRSRIGASHPEFPAESHALRASVHRDDASRNGVLVHTFSRRRMKGVGPDKIRLGSRWLCPPRSAKRAATVRSADLARIKTLATALLACSVLIAVLARAAASYHWSFRYVAAWAEAAAVGGLADWYAVVALFRHPLGVPLPHTAIIASNRARIADSFGAFVEDHFLSTAAIADKLRSVDFSALMAEWLADDRRSAGLSRFVLRMAPQALTAIEESGLRAFVAAGLMQQLRALQLAPFAAKLLAALSTTGDTSESSRKRSRC